MLFKSNGCVAFHGSHITTDQQSHLRFDLRIFLSTAILFCRKKNIVSIYTSMFEFIVTTVDISLYDIKVKVHKLKHGFVDFYRLIRDTGLSVNYG